MKVIDAPRTGKLATTVFYRSPFGQCARARTVPRDPKSERQTWMRAVFGAASRGWGLQLTELQRQHWVAAAQSAPSHPSLGQYSHLSGQQFCVQINSTLRCIGQAPVVEPPAPVVFAPSPVTRLDIVNDPEAGVRLLLSVGTVTEDIMVFGQPPCSAGRMKHRRVYYLGLAGPAINGRCDITGLYTARFGQPAPGNKVFIVTCQTRNGWKAQDNVNSAIVPPPPPAGERQAKAETEVHLPAATPEPGSNSAPPKPASLSLRCVYKGSTREPQGKHTLQPRVHPLSILCASLVHDMYVALGRLGVLGAASRAC
jgi:hypothetical protein